MRFSFVILGLSTAWLFSCSNVGERTRLLNKYGPGEYVCVDQADEYRICRHYLHGFLFSKETWHNRKLVKKEDFREDGSIHSTDEYKGDLLKITVHYVDGSKSVRVKNRGKEISYTEYDKKGREKGG